MSSYLLAIIVSDFKYNEISDSKTLFRTYSRDKVLPDTKFALDNTQILLRELESYVNYTYELPKVYSISIPDEQIP